MYLHPMTQCVRCPSVHMYVAEEGPALLVEGMALLVEGMALLVEGKALLVD